jgi:hypothetical protein
MERLKSKGILSAASISSSKENMTRDDPAYIRIGAPWGVSGDLCGYVAVSIQPVRRTGQREPRGLLARHVQLRHLFDTMILCFSPATARSSALFGRGRGFIQINPAGGAERARSRRFQLRASKPAPQRSGRLALFKKRISASHEGGIWAAASCMKGRQSGAADMNENGGERPVSCSARYQRP